MTQVDVRTHPPRHARAVGGFAAYRIERVHTHLAAQGLRVLRARCELTLRQWWVIADMAELGPETPTDLAQLADIDKGLLSRNLKSLADLGYVRLVRSREDRREQLISLTDQGWAIYRRMMPVMRARNLKMTIDVGDDEFDLFLSVLDRIETACQDDEITDEDIASAAASGAPEPKLTLAE